MRFVGVSGPNEVHLRARVATAILEVAAQGEHNPKVLCEKALRQLPAYTGCHFLGTSNDRCDDACFTMALTEHSMNDIKKSVRQRAFYELQARPIPEH